MTTKLEQAARQALEALEESCYPRLSAKHTDRYEEAITALQEALAEQAEQEPVAWICHKQNGEKSLWWNKNQALDRNAGHEFTPLYAAPVHTKDLTDNEIERALDAAKVPELPDGYKNVDIEIARAVIQEYRRKNGIV